MSVLIWIVLAFVFIKCVGWVLAPFTRHEQPEEHYHTDVRIQITDSYNTDNSQFKGGTYYGAKETDTYSTSYTNKDYFGGNQRRNHF